MNYNSILLKALCLILFGSSIILIEFVGFLQPDYNSTGHYISELGATGAQYANIINYFGFLPVAFSSLIIILFLQSKFSTSILSRIGFLCIGLGIFIGYFGAFMYPCDYGCPTEGSFSQIMHNGLGLISYVIVPAGLIILGIGSRKNTTMISPLMPFATASVYLLGFFMMINPDQAARLGFWQRLADYTLGLFLIFTSLSAKVQQKH